MHQQLRQPVVQRHTSAAFFQPNRDAAKTHAPWLSGQVKALSRETSLTERVIIVLGVASAHLEHYSVRPQPDKFAHISYAIAQTLLSCIATLSCIVCFGTHFEKAIYKSGDASTPVNHRLIVRFPSCTNSVASSFSSICNPRQTPTSPRENLPLPSQSRSDNSDREPTRGTSRVFTFQIIIDARSAISPISGAS